MNPGVSALFTVNVSSLAKCVLGFLLVMQIKCY